MQCKVKDDSGGIQIERLCLLALRNLDCLRYCIFCLSCQSQFGFTTTIVPKDKLTFGQCIAETMRQTSSCRSGHLGLPVLLRLSCDKQKADNS